MKKSQIIIAVVALAILAFFIFRWSKNDVEDMTPQVAGEQQASILGCYVARIDKDVYTMHLESQNGENVSGKLDFNNFEKDSSSGSLDATYKEGILLGNYAFQSEGMDSVMQVAFQKSGDDFIRGYGDVTQDGTKFADTSKITYDSSSPLSVFKKEECDLETFFPDIQDLELLQK